MKAIAYLALFILLCLSSWLCWQEYGFLFAKIDAVDVADLALEQDPPGQEPINLDFLNDEEQGQILDLSFLDDETHKAEPLDLSFLDAQENPATSITTDRLQPESIIADFLGVESADELKSNSIAANPICIFDPIGQGGDIHELVKGFKSLALDWGVKLDIKTFNNETVIVDSFKAERCDAIAVTGMQARPFNSFAASIEAVGGLPHYADLKTVLSHLADSAADMRQGDYEVAAVMPIGNVYAFISATQAIKKQGLQLQGKRVGIFEGNAASLAMTRQLGATPVLVHSSSFAGKFNSGAVDVIFAPAVAYQPFELYKGLAEHGRILRYPLIQLTYQLIIRHAQFPAGFGARLRQAAYKGRGFSMQYIHLTEKGIPGNHWLIPSIDEQTALEQQLLDVQQQLLKTGVYDPQMLTIMRQARCQRRPSHAECTGPTAQPSPSAP